MPYETRGKTAQQVAEYCKSQLPETRFAHAPNGSAVAQFDPVAQKWTPVLAVWGEQLYWDHSPSILVNGRNAWADTEWQEVTL